jgi:hypothetical protein
MQPFSQENKLCNTYAHILINFNNNKLGKTYPHILIKYFLKLQNCSWLPSYGLI